MKILKIINDVNPYVDVVVNQVFECSMYFWFTDNDVLSCNGLVYHVVSTPIFGPTSSEV